MTKPPSRRRPVDAVSAAEAVFKPPPPPAPEPARAPAKPGVPVAKETVTLKLDGDVLAHYQEDGPGWQDRINAALRKAAGL